MLGGNDVGGSLPMIGSFSMWLKAWCHVPLWFVDLFMLKDFNIIQAHFTYSCSGMLSFGLQLNQSVVLVLIMEDWAPFRHTKWWINPFLYVIIRLLYYHWAFCICRSDSSPGHLNEKTNESVWQHSYGRVPTSHSRGPREVEAMFQSWLTIGFGWAEGRYSSPIDDGVEMSSLMRDVFNLG